MFLFIFQGKVKVVRVQSVINTEQENKLLRGSTEDLGCSKASSHADGMYMCTSDIGHINALKVFQERQMAVISLYINISAMCQICYY
jgi:hypothetical protein